MLDQIYKHLEVRLKYSTTRRILNPLLGCWKWGQTRSFVFDILLGNCLLRDKTWLTLYLCNSCIWVLFPCWRQLHKLQIQCHGKQHYDVLELVNVTAKNNSKQFYLEENKTFAILLFRVILVLELNFELS